jgi:hypothetical protein
MTSPPDEGDLFSFTPRPRYLRENSQQYALDRGWVSPQRQIYCLSCQSNPDFPVAQPLA